MVDDAAQAALPHPSARSAALGPDRTGRPARRDRSTRRPRLFLQPRDPLMLETLARLGYVCKAFIYTIVGSLAIAAARRRGGRITDTSGALRVILVQPYGRAMLLVLAVGLSGYAVWRILDAIRDPDRHGTAFKGIVTRIGNLVRAAIYGGLGVESFRLFRGLRGSNGREAQMWTARILDIPFGPFIVGLLGAIVSVYGVSELIASFKGGYSRTLDI